MNVLFDRAIAAGRLFGVRLDGTWINVETPGSIEAATDRVIAEWGVH